VGELLHAQLDKRRTNFRIGDADRVERDVDAACLVDHGLEVPADASFVEGVDFRCLGGSSGGDDVFGHSLHGRLLAPGEKEPGSLARECACDSAADCASGSVDHRNLVLEHSGHSWWPPTRASCCSVRTASFGSTGITITVNGVPASSLTCGSALPNSLPPTIELSLWGRKPT